LGFTFGSRFRPLDPLLFISKKFAEFPLDLTSSIFKATSDLIAIYIASFTAERISQTGSERVSAP